MSMNRVIKRYSELGIKVQVFSDTTEALRWLEQQ